jgi:hypothetical protein
MKIRGDSIFVSSVLFTIALVYFIRPALWNALAGRDRALLTQMDAGFRAVAQTSHYLGVACLAIILIGLIVVWTQFIKRTRSAWLVMFVIVWLWAFPLFILPLVLPLLHGRFELTFSELLYNAISGPGLPRSVVELTLMFSVMVMALLLPIKRFLVIREGEKSVHRPSASLVSFSVIGVLIILIALYAWIRVGVLYQIPVTELSSTQRLPSPPPPPPHAGD